MGLTKKELYNAKNNGVKLVNGMEIEIVGVGTFPDTDKDGNAVNVTALKSKTGEMYTTISATVYDSVEMLSEILEEDKELVICVHEKESSSGRKFLQLEIM